MKQDQWTRQLRDKLADHEVAAPRDLWADIEAALPAQPVTRQARFTRLRRWVAIAASVAAILVAGGGYLLYSPKPQGTADAAVATLPDSNDDQLINAGEVVWRYVRLSDIEVIGRAPDHEDTALAGSAEANSSKHDDPTPKAQQQQQDNIARGQGQRGQPPTPPRKRRPEGITTDKDKKKRLSLSLYAVNGFGKQDNSSGVQMADVLARQFAGAYESSNTSLSRAGEPIYLMGYEERQHHSHPTGFGVSLSYPLSSRFTLSTGLVYTKLSSTFTQTMRSQQLQQKQRLHYIGIPIGLNYQLWQRKNFRAYASAGLRADINVSTFFATEGVRLPLAKDHVQWSFSGALGAQHNLSRRFALYAEPGLTYYPDNGSSLQNYYKEHPLTFSLQLGLRLMMGGH